MIHNTFSKYLLYLFLLFKIHLHMSTFRNIIISFLILFLFLFSRFYRDRPVFLGARTHPASFLPRRHHTRDHSLTHEILIVSPIHLAQGATSCLVYSEEFFNADVMQSTGTSHVGTSLALVLR